MAPPSDDHVRTSLGAFVLGHLDAAEAHDVRLHVEGCSACRAEAVELASVAAMLPKADLERLGPPAEVPVTTLGNVLTRIERERALRGRVRGKSVVARFVAVAAALALLAGAATLSADQAAQPPGGQTVALAASSVGVLGEAVIHDDFGSTWVELNASGLEPGETYAVWLEEAGGDRSPLGTFTGVGGDLYISLYSTLPRDRAASIGVSTPDGSTVLQGSIPAQTA